MSSNTENLFTSIKDGRSALQTYFNKLGANTEYFFFGGPNRKKLRDTVQNLSETLQAQSEHNNQTMWQNLNIVFIELFKQMEQLLVAGDANENETDKQFSLEEITILLNNICALCFAAIVGENPVVSNELLEIVLIFHGSLPVLSGNSTILPKNICKLCITWWVKDLPKKEELCLNVWIYLLRTICDVPSKKQNTYWLAELCKMQKSVGLFDLSGSFIQSSGDQPNVEDFQELRRLILKCSTHPTFLKQRKGQMFLSYILLLNQDIMKGIHGAIIDSIYSMLGHSHGHMYGNLYYLTWTLADKDQKLHFEEICIQDVMYRAVCAPRNKLASQCLFTSFQVILQEIVKQRTLPCPHMVERLYSPILWRSLKATNAMVRANAANLLFDAFPLQSDGGADKQNELLQRLFTAIESLVSDSQPQIRSLAIIGFCQIFTKHWDVIPAHVIAIQTRNICTNLAFDSSSPKVRQSVMEGLIILLSNPFSHRLLQKLLPSLSNCIHDANEKVRLFFMDLLINVKKTDLISFWDVCPVNNIIAQLDVDNHTITSRIVDLLEGSFLPPDQNIKVWVKRCINFYSRNHNAARKFYLYAKDNLSIIEAEKFILQLCASVFYFLQSSSDTSSEKLEENQNHDESSQNVSENCIDGLLETIFIMLQYVTYQVPSMTQKVAQDAQKETTAESRNLAKLIMTKLPGLLHNCFKKFHDKRKLNSLFQISACMHPSSMPVLSKSILPKLRALPEDSPDYYIKMLIQCLVKWNMGREVLDLVHEWFTASTDATQTTSKPRRSTSSARKYQKTVGFASIQNECRVKQAVIYLRFCMENESIWEKLLKDKNCIKIIYSISDFLNSCSVELISRFQNKPPTLTKWDDKMLISALELQTTLLGHMHFIHNKPDEPVTQHDPTTIVKFVNQISEGLFQTVQGVSHSSQLENLSTSMLSATHSASTEAGSNFLRRLSLCKKSLSVIFPQLAWFLKSGIQVAETSLDFLTKFFSADISATEYLGDITSLLCEIHEHMLLSDWSADEKEGVRSNFFQCLSNTLLSMVTYNRQNVDGFLETFRLSVRTPLRKIVQQHFSLSDSETKLSYPDLARGVCSVIIANILASLKSSPDAFNEINKISDLPTLSAQLVPLLCATSLECEYVTGLLLHMFNEAMSDNETPYKTNLQKTYFQLLTVLSKDSKNRSAASSVLSQFPDPREK
nr:condensin-2 complex subunit G2-like isoform X1 [Ciona intestinalis]|eukprot:XP_009860227.1 condensin-2 complex subunit G2-like isoform X1 [Ciona intestinalis]